jgi:hypothetical protein
MRQAACDDRDAPQCRARVLEADQGHGVSLEPTPCGPGGHLLLIERHRLHDAWEIREGGDLRGGQTGAAVHTDVER